jgi:hypothetical protein
MPVTAITVQSQVSSGDSTSFTISDKVKADGYYGNADGLHTVAYIVSSDYVGIIKMQASLASDPGSTDWFDITGTEFSYDGSSVTGNKYINFTGNFVWIRSHVSVDAGSITKIQLNY